MHGLFFPGAFLWPALFFFGLFRILLFVLVIALIVRLVSHGHRHAEYAHGHGYGPGFGYGWRHGHDFDTQSLDPRRIAAWRYAAGKIDRAEFDRIMGGLDASATAPAPPTVPPTAPPAAPPLA
jgi:uncharacterized membrane protein